MDVAGTVHQLDARDNVVHSTGNAVVLYGVSDLVVVCHDGVTLVTTVDWTADGSQLVTVLIPDARKAEPKRPAIETGPLVRLTDEKKDDRRVSWQAV